MFVRSYINQFSHTLDFYLRQLKVQQGDDRPQVHGVDQIPVEIEQGSLHRDGSNVASAHDAKRFQVESPEFYY